MGSPTSVARKKRYGPGRAGHDFDGTDTVAETAKTLECISRQTNVAQRQCNLPGVLSQGSLAKEDAPPWIPAAPKCHEPQRGNPSSLTLESPKSALGENSLHLPNPLKISNQSGIFLVCLAYFFVAYFFVHSSPHGPRPRTPHLLPQQPRKKTHQRPRPRHPGRPRLSKPFRWLSC